MASFDKGRVQRAAVVPMRHQRLRWRWHDEAEVGQGRRRWNKHASHTVGEDKQQAFTGMKVRNLIHLRFDVHDPIQLLLQPASQVPILLSLAAAIGCGRQLVTTSFAFFF